jgi:hypothetical protein
MVHLVGIARFGLSSIAEGGSEVNGGAGAGCSYAVPAFRLRSSDRGVCCPFAARGRIRADQRGRWVSACPAGGSRDPR